MEIISRSQAKSSGIKKYFTGKQCIRGHISQRYTLDGQCIECKSRPERKEYMSNYLKKYYLDNKDKFALYSENRRSSPNYKIYVAMNCKRYRLKNKRAVLDNQNSYRRGRYSADVEFRLSIVIRQMIRRCASGRKVDLPYSADDLRARIECQFLPGMSWKNHGEWHIDHKKPVARFLRQGIRDPRLINALCNLQPLWACDNRRKSDAF